VTTTEPEITIIIPTHNRPAFLNRLLTYFIQVECPLPILVVDSSAANLREDCDLAVSAAKSHLDIKYRHVDFRFEQKCLAAFDDVTTQYIVLCADDDFVNPFALEPCISFLKDNPDYAAVRGAQFIQTTDGKRRTKPTRFRNLDSSDPVKRFTYFSDNWYSTFYCVHRTLELRRDFETTCEHANSEHTIILPELLLSYLSVIRGGTRYLPHFFGLRQAHANAASRVSPKITDTANYDAHYSRFIECTAQELSAVSALSQEASVRLVGRCHGRVRAKWESNTRRKRSEIARVMHELLRPIHKAVKFFRHGIVRDKWRTHPNSKGLEKDTNFQLMSHLIETFPSGCNQDEVQSHSEAA
jgi:glycosyltransferase domain-containing protein